MAETIPRQIPSCPATKVSREAFGGQLSSFGEDPGTTLRKPATALTALKAESVQVFAAPLPLTSLADAVAALNRSLDRTQGPIVLAGHAYAGAVIALARPERVKPLVYVTALAPDEGEKVADLFYRLKAHAIDHIPVSPVQRRRQTYLRRNALRSRRLEVAGDWSK